MLHSNTPGWPGLTCFNFFIPLLTAIAYPNSNGGLNAAKESI